MIIERETKVYITESDIKKAFGFSDSFRNIELRKEGSKHRLIITMVKKENENTKTN